MSVTKVDRSREVLPRYEDAARRGLDGAATHLLNEIRKAFGSSYYLGGRFRSTLQVKQSTRRLPPYKGPSGWETVVGTKLIEALYWELGHRNIFTRNPERVQIWVPTATANADRMQKTFAYVVARLMGRP